MHITYVTEHDIFNPDYLSGTPYWIAEGLKREGIQLHNLYVSLPQRLLPPLEELAFRFRQQWLKIRNKGYRCPQLFSRRAFHIAEMLSARLSRIKTDAILTTLTPIAPAFLEAPAPIVYWTDAVYAAMANFYPRFRSHHPDTAWDGHIVTNATLRNATLLIFSSQWAARTAVEFYGIARDKIKVVPFGANIEIDHQIHDVKQIIKMRSKDKIKLLFVGIEWYRKGGDTAVEVAKELVAAGYPVELTIVGCKPSIPLPSFVKCENFISKKSAESLSKLKRLYQEAHFLILPSRAEACAMVFAEANAFGLPCLTTYVGGISEAIQDGQNGMTFSLEAPVKNYCDYIVNTIHDDAKYTALCLSSFNEYEKRLNWKSACQQVKKLISEI